MMLTIPDHSITTYCLLWHVCGCNLNSNAIQDQAIRSEGQMDRSQKVYNNTTIKTNRTTNNISISVTTKIVLCVFFYLTYPTSHIPNRNLQQKQQRLQRLRKKSYRLLVSCVQTTRYKYACDCKLALTQIVNYTTCKCEELTTQSMSLNVNKSDSWFCWWEMVTHLC